ncbi:MAG: low affinity iron permease family protein [Steroidobacteraceae bacterium]|jgi:low affinity Fe/Cu permease
MQTAFRQLLLRASQWLGSPWAITIAAMAVFAWAIVGHRYRYSDHWQLAIDTTTSIVTFLMVFLIQYSQTRDVNAIQLKLDELIRAVEGARNHLVQLEGLSDEEIISLRDEFRRLQGEARWSRRGQP